MIWICGYTEGMTNTAKRIKVQAGTQEMVHYSVKLAGRNRRPICGTASRSANFTPVSDSREVTCSKCKGA